MKHGGARESHCERFECPLWYDTSMEVAENMLVARPVTRKDDAYPEVRTLYHEAFPAKERFSLPTLLFFSHKSGVDFTAYFDPIDEDQLCGMSYTIEAGGYLYIMYLAVVANARGKGYGTRILDQLKRRYPHKTLVLDIEPLDKKASNYDQRVQRLKFYERNGFSLVGYDMFTGAVRDVVLASEEDFDPKAFSKAVHRLSHGLCRFTILPAG